MRKVCFAGDGWEDYKYWQQTSRETLLKINDLLKSIERDGAMNGWDIPLKIRQQILGHTSKDIINRVYTHKTIQQLIDAINRL